MITTVFAILVLVFSVIIHELAHGYAADLLGDPTPRYYGRLTMNPIAHVDLYGTILIPFFLYTMTGGAMWFGWAKPVPINPYKLRDQKWGPLKVSLAGPLSNITLAVIFGTIIRTMGAPTTVYTVQLFSMFQYIVIINLSLAIFNLMPIPPLDGSHVAEAFIPGYGGRLRMLPMYIQFIALFLIIRLLSPFIVSLISIAFTLVTGIA